MPITIGGVLYPDQQWYDKNIAKKGKKAVGGREVSVTSPKDKIVNQIAGGGVGLGGISSGISDVAAKTNELLQRIQTEGVTGAGGQYLIQPTAGGGTPPGGGLPVFPSGGGGGTPAGGNIVNTMGYSDKQKAWDASPLRQTGPYHPSRDGELNDYLASQGTGGGGDVNLLDAATGTTSKDDLINKLVDALTKFSGAGTDWETEREKLREEKGATGLREQVGTFDDEINKAKDLLDDLDTRIRGGMAAEEARLAPMELITGRQAELQRQAGVERGDVLSTLGTLQRSREGAAGQLATTEQDILDILEAREKERMQPLQALGTEIGLRQDIQGLFPEEETVAEKPKTQITEAGGRRLVINTETGDIIADLGTAGTQAAAKVTDQDRVTTIRDLLTSVADQSGLVNSATYVSAAQTWISMGGTFSDFKVAFPPEVYLDEKEQGNLPSSLRPKGVEPQGEFGDFGVQIKAVIQQMKDNDMSRGDAKDYLLSQYEQEYGEDNVPKIIKNEIEDILIEVYGKTLWQKIKPEWKLP